MVSLRHRLGLSALLAASAASMLIACGGKVVVDAAGATGGGGSAATSTTSVGAGGCCEGLQAEFAARLATAQSCDPDIDVPQCTGAVTTVDLCGCPVAANDGKELAAQLAITAWDAWVSEGCGPVPCFACPPPPTSPWFCDPTTAVCRPAFEK
jgi:hypothetical protein